MRRALARALGAAPRLPLRRALSGLGAGLGAAFLVTHLLSSRGHLGCPNFLLPSTVAAVDASSRTGGAHTCNPAGCCRTVLPQPCRGHLRRWRLTMLCPVPSPTRDGAGRRSPAWPPPRASAPPRRPASSELPGHLSAARLSVFFFFMVAMHTILFFRILFLLLPSIPHKQHG